MNLELRRTVQKVLASESDPAVAAQALNDYWWFRHGQPHELTEILETTIQYYLLKEVSDALDTYTRKARQDRVGQQDWLPLEGDWHRDEWATEEVRPERTRTRPV